MTKTSDTYSKDFLMNCSKEDFEYYTADEDYLQYYDEAGIPPSASHAFDYEQEIVQEQKSLSYEEWKEMYQPDIYREDICALSDHLLCMQSNHQTLRHPLIYNRPLPDPHKRSVLRILVNHDFHSIPLQIK